MQSTDLVLGGLGYMVLPGSYRRMSDGEAEGRGGVWVQRDFVGGQRRALQLERDRGWDAEGVGPALGGQGVEPWPYNTSNTDGAIVTAPTSSVVAHHAVAGNNVYIGIGRYLYRSVALTAGAWANLTQIAEMGAGNTITDLAVYAGKIAVCCGSTKDIQLWDPATSTLSTFSAGERGNLAIGYANRLIWADATSGGDGTIKLSTGGGNDTRALDASIVKLGLHGGKVVIATRTSLYLLGGKGDPATGKWTADPEPVFTHGLWTDSADYSFLTSYGGKLYTWLAGQVMEWNPNGGASKQGWRATGIEGRDCFGGVVAGDRLIVAVKHRNGSGELWSYDGTGWWLIETGSLRFWPVYLAGAGNLDLLAFRSGSTTYDLYRLIYRDSANPNFRSSGSYKTSLIDAGAREQAKAWRAIGVSFATPEDRGNTASADSVTVTISYSVDGGATFVTHGGATLNDPTQRTVEYAAPLAGGSVESTTIQVLVAWSSVLDWAPTLTGIWVAYELLGTLVRKQRWRCTLLARDGLVQRDGAVHARSGQQIAADLWSAWQTATTLTLRDLDYDLTARQYAVRVTGLDEDRPKPADGANWGDALLTVSLAEV